MMILREGPSDDDANPITDSLITYNLFNIFSQPSRNS